MKRRSVLSLRVRISATATNNLRIVGPPASASPSDVHACTDAYEAVRPGQLARRHQRHCPSGPRISLRARTTRSGISTASGK